MGPLALGLATCVCLVACTETGIPVSRQTIGDEWPFATIESGAVECESGGAATFVASGQRYALNGLAKSKYGYSYPYEAGIVRQVPLSVGNPTLGSINADTEVLRKLCDK